METNNESPTPPNLEVSTTDGSSSIQSNAVQQNITDDTNEKNDIESIDGSENKRTGRKESEAWKHFDRVTINGEKKARCKYCKRVYVARSSDGTTHLLKHNSKCHGKAQVDMRQYALKNARSSDGKVHISNYVFDQEKARSDLARMIIMHEYPLSIVDHIGFINFCQTLQPAFTLVSRNTIKGDIMKIFDVEKASLMKMLDKNKSRIAITSDMWTASNQKKGYMVVTAHFIDDSWALQSRIMRFTYVPCPHTSDVLADCLLTCFLDWNIDRKLSTITLDNCSTNDKVMDILKDRLRKNSLMLNGDMVHMRCCAHILNLIVQDGLCVINEQITKIRDSVSFWTATPKRLERFEIAAKQLEISCSKKLTLDCKTRWNSTYVMLVIALAYKDVFPRLQQRETLYKCLPSDRDWDLAKEICDRLKIFYNVTKLFSGTQYPTANLYFPQICEIRLALSTWLVSDILVIREIASNMVTKFEKYWSMIHGIMSIAAVFDPRYKFELLEFYYVDIFGENAEEEINKIQTLCHKLLNEYEQKEKMVSRSSENGSSFSLQAQTTQLCSIKDGFTSLQRFDEYLNRKISKANTKSELDRYLEEPILPISDSFDILAWWKTTGIRYPIMQMIAKDIYAIPISTVASESAFSTSGRLISPHRSRLHPTTLEALMCCQSWLTVGSSKGRLISTMDNDSDSDSDGQGVGSS